MDFISLDEPLPSANQICQLTRGAGHMMFYVSFVLLVICFVRPQGVTSKTILAQ